MCAAIIAYIPFIIVINKNILNRRAPAVKFMSSTRSTVTSANSHPVEKDLLHINTLTEIPDIYRLESPDTYHVRAKDAG